MDHKTVEELTSLSNIFFERFFEDWSHLSDEHFLDYLTPKIDQIITLEELKKRLASNKRLIIKFGIDPTSADVHLGHAVPILVLRQFQKAGHAIHLIIGDFTAMIGDPSGRNDQRPALTEKEIKNNFKTYLSQIGKFLDVKKTKNHRNSRWLSRRNLTDVIKDLQQVNLSEVLQRDDFRKRIEQGHPLSVAELLYSYAQGVDSMVLEPDIEVGGRDQLLNFAQARGMMETKGQEPEIALTTPVLEGTSGDGRKMSKSYGNYIALHASLEDKFGKIMSITDNVLEQYYRAFTDIKESELPILRKHIEENPLEAKKQLAEFLVSVEAKNQAAGKEERERFEKRFSKKVFDDVEAITVPQDTTFFEVIEKTGVYTSKSEMRRAFEQGAIGFVEPEEKPISPDQKAEEGTMKVGKKKFFRIIIES